MLYTIKEEHPEAIKQYLTPIIGQWNEAFVAILNKRTSENPEIEVGEWGLKTEILKVSPEFDPHYVRPSLHEESSTANFSSSFI